MRLILLLLNHSFPFDEIFKICHACRFDSYNTVVDVPWIGICINYCSSLALLIIIINDSHSLMHLPVLEFTIEYQIGVKHFRRQCLLLLHWLCYPLWLRIFVLCCFHDRLYKDVIAWRWGCWLVDWRRVWHEEGRFSALLATYERDSGRSTRFICIGLH